MSEAPNSQKSQTQGGDLGGWGGVVFTTAQVNQPVCVHVGGGKANRSEEDSCCGCGGHQAQTKTPRGAPPDLEPSSHGDLFSPRCRFVLKQIKLFIENLNISMSYLVKI